MEKFIKDVFANVVANLVVIGITSFASLVITVGSGLWIVITHTNIQSISVGLWIVLIVAFALGTANLILGIFCFIKRKK